MNKNYLSLSEIKELQLNILEVIDSFCKKKELRYSLAAGSLLGAVRHHGYIPWDDDIDIMMPRPDYDVFVMEFIGYSPNLIMQDVSTDPCHYLPWAKVYDNRTECISYNSISGVYVDVFPIDGLPDKSLLVGYYKSKQKISKLLWQSRKINYHYLPNNSISLRIKTFIKRFVFPSRNKVIVRWKKLYNTYPYESSKYAGAITSIYGMREHMPKTVFDNYVDLPFEGKYYKCIKAYDSYLSKLYGDYMRLPPVEKRVSHHNNVVYWK